MGAAASRHGSSEYDPYYKAWLASSFGAGNLGSTGWGRSDDPIAAQRRDHVALEAKPVSKHISGMFAEQRRRLDLCGDAVEAHWPGGHCHGAFAMLHRL